MKKIAALDIESCSTKQRAHIFEVGIVLATHTPNGVVYDDEEDEDYRPSLSVNEKVGFTFDLIEQMNLNRLVDAKTMAFHAQHRGAAARTMLTGSEQYPLVTLHEGFDIIRDKLKDVELLWINGLSFDPSLLISLRDECEYPHDLWDFRTECDVRTIRTTNDLIYRLTHDERERSTHQAIKDAEWNLFVANKYLNWVDKHQPRAKSKAPKAKSAAAEAAPDASAG